MKAATAPFQHALSTRAVCECVAHALQSMCEADPHSTVLSIYGIGAFDLVSRTAMLRGLCRVPDGPDTLPFVRMFYGQASVYLWEDDEGIVHDIHQGEGGEQGDALMPLLFSLGQHPALQAVQAQLLPGETVFAYLDDVYVTTTPARVGAIYRLFKRELWIHANIRSMEGKTRVWNSGGHRQAACDELERISRAVNGGNVWRGSQVPPTEQGIKVLGCPLGHTDFVDAHLERTTREHSVLFERIPSVPDLQSAWLFLTYCAAAKATYLLRVLPPTLVRRFAEDHDDGCGVVSVSCWVSLPTRATLFGPVPQFPSSLEGLGLRRSPVRTSESTYLASWADCLPMMRERHPEVAREFMTRLEAGVETQCWALPRHLPATWHPRVRATLIARPPPREPDDYEPGAQRLGWQHEASSRVELQFRELQLMPGLSEGDRALMRC